MKKLYVFLLLVLPVSAFAQRFNDEISEHRRKYLEEFKKDAASPLRAEDLTHISFYPPDSSYRVQALVTLSGDTTRFRMPTYDGTSKEFVRYALLSFSLHGKPYRLTLYQSISLRATEEYKNYLFLPFTDNSNGTETYGGGRYIDLQSTDIIDGKISIDFNRAYNPYCAYSSGYRCPVPPAENDLPLAVSAGEKNYTGPKKKTVPEYFPAAAELWGTWKLTALSGKQISHSELQKRYIFTKEGAFAYQGPASERRGRYVYDEKTGIAAIFFEEDVKMRIKIEKKEGKYLLYTLDQSSVPGIIQKME